MNGADQQHKEWTARTVSILQWLEGCPTTPLKGTRAAEANYDVEETLRRRGGRPPIGSAAASVESLRLDSELREALAERAKRDHETT